jgi:hypothetical protein
LRSVESSFCQLCGREYEYDFRRGHVSNKKFNVAGSQHRSWTMLKAELDKCVLLCLNCHAEKHERVREQRYALERRLTG